jgi:SAM-dependent methyltransferase
MEIGEYHTLAQLEGQHWWYIGMRAIAHSLLRRLPLPPHAQILDAGCGVGGGLRWLSALGETAGFDLHPLAVRYALPMQRPVCQASIQAIPFPMATFDLVTSFDVLYHLNVHDDWAALQELARVLRPGGWLMVRLPAHSWLRGAHDQQVHTRHRYTASELRQKILATSLRLKRLTYVGAGLFPLAVVWRGLQRFMRPRSDVTLPQTWLNTILAQTLAAERFWLQYADLPVGLSLLALAQKTA